MNFHDLVSARRSIKHFDADHHLTEAEVNQLVEDAMYAPTSFNIQHWRFVHVTDTELRAEIRAAALDQAQVTDASELFVVTADVQAWRKQPERYWRTADNDTRAYLVNMIADFYNGREWIQRDEAIRSGAFAAQNMMLSAKSMGYDSCPMIGFDQEKVANIIKLPEDHLIVMMLVVGKAKAEAWPRGGQLARNEVLVNNHF